nr:Ubiquinol oxidase subunit 2 precursor [Candidatus Pantoea persica]
MALWGWATFYAFTVASALPGLLLLLFCRDPLNMAQHTASAFCRARASRPAIAGWRACSTRAAALWLAALFEAGMGLLALAVYGGVTLDYLALRKKGTPQGAQ